jgi:hypothetical protein
VKCNPSNITVQFPARLNFRMWNCICTLKFSIVLLECVQALANWVNFMLTTLCCVFLMNIYCIMFPWLWNRVETVTHLCSTVLSSWLAIAQLTIGRASALFRWMHIRCLNPCLIQLYVDNVVLEFSHEYIALCFPDDGSEIKRSL